VKVAFRVDVTPTIGFGHLLRCLSLAEVFLDHGVEVVFVCCTLPAILRDKLSAKQIAFVTFAESGSILLGNELSDSYTYNQHLDASLTIQSLQLDNVDIVVVDHYRLDKTWEILLRPYCQKIVTFDDFTGRHHCCDYIIDQNISDLLSSHYLECFVR